MFHKNKDLRFWSLTWPTIDHGVEHLILRRWKSTFLALQRLGWRTFSPEELAEPWSSASAPSTTTSAFFLATIGHLLQNNKFDVTKRQSMFIDDCFINTPSSLSINTFVQWFTTSLIPPTTKWPNTRYTTRY